MSRRSRSCHRRAIHPAAVIDNGQLAHERMQTLNPELQAKLVTYLEGLEKGAAKVGEFAEREIPETVREWLLWMAIENFAYAAIMIVVAGLCFIAMRKIIKIHGGLSGIGPQNDTPLPAIFVVALPVIAVVLMVAAVPHLMMGVKVLVAPRVVIVEKVAELTRGK